jgi:hypothetical protein
MMVLSLDHYCKTQDSASCRLAILLIIYFITVDSISTH